MSGQDDVEGIDSLRIGDATTGVLLSPADEEAKLAESITALNAVIRSRSFRDDLGGTDRLMSARTTLVTMQGTLAMSRGRAPATDTCPACGQALPPPKTI